MGSEVVVVATVLKKRWGKSVEAKTFVIESGLQQGRGEQKELKLPLLSLVFETVRRRGGGRCDWR